MLNLFMATTAATSRQAPTPQHEDRLLNVVAWIELHRKYLATGFIGLVLVFAGVYLWRHFAEERELEANRALLELRQRPRPGRTESSTSPADYLRVAEKYSSTSVAPRARLLAAGGLF